jgi:hypothetical protein
MFICTILITEKNIRIKKKDMIERNSLFVNLIVSSVIGRLDPSGLIMSLSFRSVFSIKEKNGIGFGVWFVSVLMSCEMLSFKM